jgi:hypothetical protein
VGVGIAAVAAAGAVAVLTGPRPRRGRAAVLVGLVVTAAAFTLSTAVTRTELHGLDGAKEQRYVHVLVALAIPVVAAGIEWMQRRSAWLGALGVGVLALGVPSNVDALDEEVPPNTLAAYVRSDALAGANPDRVLHPLLPLLVGDLQDAATNPGEWADVPVTPGEQLQADLFLAVEQRDGPPGGESCSVVPELRLTTTAGLEIPFAGTVTVVARDGDVQTAAVPYAAADGDQLLITAALDLTVAAVAEGSGVLRC